MTQHVMPTIMNIRYHEESIAKQSQEASQVPTDNVIKRTLSQVQVLNSHGKLQHNGSEKRSQGIRSHLRLVWHIVA